MIFVFVVILNFVAVVFFVVVILIFVVFVVKDYAIIMGHVSTCEETREKYRVDEVSTIGTYRYGTYVFG